MITISNILLFFVVATITVLVVKKFKKKDHRTIEELDKEKTKLEAQYQVSKKKSELKESIEAIKAKTKKISNPSSIKNRLAKLYKKIGDHYRGNELRSEGEDRYGLKTEHKEED